MDRLEDRKVPRRARVGFVLGPALFLLLLILPAPSGMPPEAWRTAAVGVLMAVWWISEAIPIPVTAILPLVLFPLLGVATIGESTAPFANPVVFLSLGGFLIALAMERWNLHRRVALYVLSVVGTRPAAVIGGFMVASALLSMWVSNTATAVMMLPIGVSVIALLTRSSLSGADSGPTMREVAQSDGFPLALMLGIAYACTIGGLATIIGTPPNAFLAAFMLETYGVEIGFDRWMLLGVPMMLAGLPIAWVLLTKWAYSVSDEPIPGARELVAEQRRGLGPITRGEGLVAAVFAFAALSWMFQRLIAPYVPGISDAGIAMTAAFLLFVIPVNLRKGQFLMSWEWALKVPWGVLILFGGGLSLAAAIASTGLADWIGTSMAGLQTVHLFFIVLAIVTVTVLLTELTSNVATAAAFLPILASLAIGMGVDPLLLVVPATLATSCAFMLPVATPPNAIIYGSGYVTIPEMARAGLMLNILFMGLVSLLGYFLVMLIFG